MDRSETLARDYLMFRGFQSIVYEPDGNVPPDFIIDGRIAMEVRRLNENERELTTPKGLEEVEIPLLIRLRSMLSSFGPAGAFSWWVALHFKRPVPSWATLEKRIRPFLEDVTGMAIPSPGGIKFDSIELQVFPRRGTGGYTFELAITSDDDSGGWVLEELERNLRLCINEKSNKVGPFRSKYPEWWLLLIDQVAYGLSDFDRAQFEKSAVIEHDWDKVILINPLDHTHYFELKGKGTSNIS